MLDCDFQFSKCQECVPSQPLLRVLWQNFLNLLSYHIFCFAFLLGSLHTKQTNPVSLASDGHHVSPGFSFLTKSLPVFTGCSPYNLLITNPHFNRPPKLSALLITPYFQIPYPVFLLCLDNCPIDLSNLLDYKSFD